MAFINNKILATEYFQKIFRNIKITYFSKEKNFSRKLLNIIFLLDKKIKEEINSINNSSSKTLKEVIEHKINLILSIK